MSLDPFGHNAVTRHFINAMKKRLAEESSQEIKAMLQKHIDDMEDKIKRMELSEIAYRAELQKTGELWAERHKHQARLKCYTV